MNENWRILLALALTMIVLLVWNLWFTPQQGVMGPENRTRPAQQEQRTEADRQEPPQQEEPRAEKLPEEDRSASEKSGEIQDTAKRENEFSGQRSVTVDTPLYRAVINTRGGILEHFRLKRYKESIKKDSPPVDLVGEEGGDMTPMGILWNDQGTWQRAQWSSSSGDLRLRGSEERTITLIGKLGNVTLERELTFSAGSYRIQERLRLLNRSQGSLSGALSFTLATPPLVENPSRYNTNQFITFADGSLTSWDDKDTLGEGVRTQDPVQWAGVGSSYFLLGLVPRDNPMYARGQFEDNIYRAALESRVSLERGQSQEILLDYYLGPKVKKQLQVVPGNLVKAMNYGWFNVIAKPLVEVLTFFNTFTGNYGLAIILLTLVIKIIFWPLSQKSYKSMEKMKKIQPMMKEIKEKYKDDRQKMNQELMQLYKTYKVNPAGGCLPMLLQIPVFIGLFEGLMGAVELRHAPFIPHVPFTDIVWLADLASKDPLYITPVLMGLSMFLQQKLSPTAGDPTQAKIMMFMPIFLTFIFLNFPAGLVVYFITNNILSIAQQWWMMRKA